MPKNEEPKRLNGVNPLISFIKPGFCVYCGAPAQGKYTIHLDFEMNGPEVDLCDMHGEGSFPTCDEIWAAILDHHIRDRRVTSLDVWCHPQVISNDGICWRYKLSQGVYQWCAEAEVRP